MSWNSQCLAQGLLGSDIYEYSFDPACGAVILWAARDSLQGKLCSGVGHTHTLLCICLDLYTASVTHASS